MLLLSRLLASCSVLGGKTRLEGWRNRTIISEWIDVRVFGHAANRANQSAADDVSIFVFLVQIVGYELHRLRKTTTSNSNGMRTIRLEAAEWS